MLSQDKKNVSPRNKSFVKATFDGQNIIIHRMDHPSCVSSFHRILIRQIRNGQKAFGIKYDEGSVYPDACVPIAGLIAYYKENYQIDFTYDIQKGSYLEHCGFCAPFVMEAEQISKESSPLDKIFRYSTSAQVAAITQAYIDCISRQKTCAEGVLDGLSWCLNEVIDNVLLHSEAGYGFVMAQYHEAKNTIAICVFDSGIGIYNSLKKTSHRPRYAIDAISLAIQEGVGDGKGQGNGLYGLYQIVIENGGTLNITSGPASIMWNSSGEMRKFDNLPYISSEYNGTAIDYRLNLNRSIDLQKAFKSLGGYDPFDIRIDDMLQEDDSIKYNVFENSMGTATREAGRLLRNDILNIITRTHSKIILEFAGVKTVSSSFIDELLSKMIIDLGVIRFNQLIHIVNMNDNVKFLCERAVYMRIYEEWKKQVSQADMKNEQLEDLAP